MNRFLNDFMLVSGIKGRVVIKHNISNGLAKWMESAGFRSSRFGMDPERLVFIS
ncbi:hypothetical protein D3C76_1810510 [compost metagenome]